MQSRGGGRDDFFDPFAGFGFGSSRDLMSSFFSRDPFDDPFFTRPFGSMFGPSMFGSPFGDPINSGFIEHQPHQYQTSKGPIIEAISSDEEDGRDHNEKKDKPARHSMPSKEPFVQDPDEQHGEKNRHVQYRNDYHMAQRAQPQTRSFSFQSSTVTYGGANGAYYTASTTRRTGGDGVTLEESKEADTTTGRAAHRISRGIRDKGHSMTRKLNSDGKVDTMQTLHNLNEDELGGFEEDWKGNARKHLPGWDRDFVMLEGHMVHAANKLASKHQRVPLVNSGTQKTKCDICEMHLLGSDSTLISYLVFGLPKLKASMCQKRFYHFSAWTNFFAKSGDDG